jgi:hypothetical protein
MIINFEAVSSPTNSNRKVLRVILGLISGWLFEKRKPGGKLEIFRKCGVFATSNETGACVPLRKPQLGYPHQRIQIILRNIT